MAACGASTQPEIRELAPGKWGTGEVLNDLAPMTDRVPSLATATAVAYVGGPSAEPDSNREVTVPGPTDLWIDAVVTFAPDDDVPARQCGSADTLGVPSVVPALAGSVSGGAWIECSSDAFSAPGWWVTALFDPDDNVVVLHLASL